MGAESYGLVIFYGTLATSLTILDLGLSTTINRQAAILVAQGQQQRLKTLVFSVELIYWFIAIVVGGLILLAAPFIAVHWVKANDLPVETIQKAIMLMGVVFACQFPASIYTGVLEGVGKAEKNAILSLIFTTLKAIGVIAVLQLVNASVLFYFAWQASLTAILTILLRVLVGRSLSTSQTPAHFSKTELKTIWRFAAGITGISLLTFFLEQIDKIIVSKYVTLDLVGYYGLAFMVAGGITQLISPLKPVIFPKFSALMASGHTADLLLLFHKACRWVAIIVFPIGFTLVLFAKEILLFWTKNPTLTQQTTPVLQLISAGAICNGLMWIPYNFLLAKGNTRFTIYQNTIAAMLIVPLLFWCTSHYGILGAGAVWLTVNVGYVAMAIPLFFRFNLSGQYFYWLKHDIALPLGVAGVIALAAKFTQVYWLPAMSLVSFFALLTCCMGLYSLAMPEIRGLLRQGWSS